MAPPHPGLGPQRLEQRGKGRRKGRLKAICIACGGMRLASSHGTWIVAVGYKCLQDFEDLCYADQRTCYIKYVNITSMIS